MTELNGGRLLSMNVSNSDTADTPNLITDPFFKS